MKFQNKNLTIKYIKNLIDRKLSQLNDSDITNTKVHDFDDKTITVQTFSGWKNSELCEQGIKLKKIKFKDKKAKFSILGYFPANSVIPEHSNDYKECYICLKGGFIITIDDESYYVDDFNEFCTSKNIPHSAKFIKDSYVIIYSPDVL